MPQMQRFGDILTDLAKERGLSVRDMEAAGVPRTTWFKWRRRRRPPERDRGTGALIATALGVSWQDLLNAAAGRPNAVAGEQNVPTDEQGPAYVAKLERALGEAVMAGRELNEQLRGFTDLWTYLPMAVVQSDTDLRVTMTRNIQAAVTVGQELTDALRILVGALSTELFLRSVIEDGCRYHWQLGSFWCFAMPRHNGSSEIIGVTVVIVNIGGFNPMETP